MLNKPLFSALELRFGKGSVRIAKEDEPMILTKSPSPVLGSDGKRRDTVTIIASGEEYRTNCPRCGDTRSRLSINHAWGTYRFGDGSLNLWTIQCWNENCFAEFRERAVFFDQVFDTCEYRKREAARLDWSAHSRLRRPGARSVEPPGPVENLVKLGKRFPDHPVFRYLRSRFIDPHYIGSVFDVGFCFDSCDYLASSRIFVPIKFAGKLAGYQCRYLGTPPSKRVPPWYSCPAMRKSELLYNYDVASQYRTIFLVEGPGDVWGTGKRGVAVLGKTVADAQIKLLAKACDSKTTIVLMFDPELSPDSEEKVAQGRTVIHHIEKARQRLVNHHKLAGRVVTVYLPGRRDPNTFDQGYLFDLANFEAKKLGLTLDFGRKPAKKKKHENQIA